MGANMSITRTTWRRGVKHQLGIGNNAAKLTDSDVRNIRAITSDTALLSHAYGISMRAVQRIRARQTWQHVV